MDYILGISGTRGEFNENFVRKKFNSYLKKYGIPVRIIVGDCRGIDSFIRKICVEKEIEVKVKYADWKKYGKAAGPLRNKEICNEIDRLLAFPSQQSVGTIQCINTAKQMKIPVKTYYVD